MKNIKLFVTFVASLFFLFSCEKEKVETCGFDTIRLTESFLTEYAKGDGVDNYMIALASGPTVFDPTNQQWHTENDGWVMLISLFAEPVANLGAPEIPEGKYTIQRIIYHFFMKCFWSNEMSFSDNSVVNYDWYHPQDCSRHKIEEVRQWFELQNLIITHECVDFYGITIRGKMKDIKV